MPCMCGEGLQGQYALHWQKVQLSEKGCRGLVFCVINITMYVEGLLTLRVNMFADGLQNTCAQHQRYRVMEQNDRTMHGLRSVCKGLWASLARLSLEMSHKGPPYKICFAWIQPCMEKELNLEDRDWCQNVLLAEVGKVTITSGLHLRRSEVLRSFKRYLRAQSWGHHTIDCLEERGMERGGTQQPS